MIVIVAMLVIVPSLLHCAGKILNKAIKKVFSIQERGNVRKRFVESSQGLTKGPHSMHLYANFEIRNANLEMPKNKTDFVERETELEEGLERWPCKRDKIV